MPPHVNTLTLDIRKLPTPDAHFEIQVPVCVENRSGVEQIFPCLIDTGADYTTISIDVARTLGIPFRTDRPADIRGATGRGPSAAYLSEVTFSFPYLPGHTFTSVWCFSPYPGSVRTWRTGELSLLSFNDLHKHFDLKTEAPTSMNRWGALTLTLRKHPLVR